MGTEPLGGSIHKTNKFFLHKYTLIKLLRLVMTIKKPA